MQLTQNQYNQYRLQDNFKNNNPGSARSTQYNPNIRQLVRAHKVLHYCEPKLLEK